MACICNGISSFFESCMNFLLCGHCSEPDSLVINVAPAVARAKPLIREQEDYGTASTTARVAQRSLPVDI